MAAGYASRFGSIKQIAAVGPSGEILADYAIKEAQELGFLKVVIITREELVEQFKAHFRKQNLTIPIEYICQDKYIPEINVQKDVHLYGTGVALLTAIPSLTDDFIIINGDDYYGNGVFSKINESFSMFPDYSIFLAGYNLFNTLSPNGSVSRAVCMINKNNELVDLNEHTKISKNIDEILSEDSGQILEPNTLVSMNCWGFRTSFLDTVKSEFKEYISNATHWKHKEFSLPDLVKRHLINSPLSAKLIPVNAKWVGLTYHEDMAQVIEFLKKL